MAYQIWKMPDVPAFKKTASPDELKVSDVSSWCRELGDFIDANPSSPELWRAEAAVIFSKIKAICVITACSDVGKPK